MRILIVDDIETNRKLLRINFESEGIHASEAGDGVEALAALERGKHGAIISDILMPHMDGYHLCRLVRKEDRLARAPFIFYTSTYTTPSDENLALDCGADRYLKKPSPIGLIIDTIRELQTEERRRPAEPLPEDAQVMQEYNAALVRKLEERNEKLEQARAELALAKEEPERRVEERTNQLVIANKELEAFSHSIAHDLHSPLNTINGFTDILVEECLGKANREVMDGLAYIAEAVRRMSNLTDDLLRLSRANHAEI